MTCLRNTTYRKRPNSDGVDGPRSISNAASVLDCRERLALGSELRSATKSKRPIGCERGCYVCTEWQFSPRLRLSLVGVKPSTS